MRAPKLLLVSITVSIVIAFGHGIAATAVVTNGPIVFTTGTNDLWSIQPDGTDLRLLTTVASTKPNAFVTFPSFSADGSKLAVMLNEFEQRCEPPRSSFSTCRSFVLMNGDGSGQRVVYRSSKISTLHLALSPDGTQIASTRISEDSGADLLFVVAGRGRVLGRDRWLRTLTPYLPGAADLMPSWSPDGRTLAFHSNRDSAVTGQGWSLFFVSLETGELRRIIPASMNNDLHVQWAPTGTQLVFTRTFAYPDYRIYTVNPDGTGEFEIVRDFSASQVPAFSPDGTRIAFLRQDHIWVADADGSNAYPLVAGGRFGFSWQPQVAGQLATP